MYDISSIKDDLPVSDFPKATRQLITGIEPYLNVWKCSVPNTVVGSVVGWSNGYVLADKDKPETLNDLAIVVEDGYLCSSCYLALKSAVSGKDAYVGNSGAIVYEKPASGTVRRIGHGENGGVRFTG